ncbi:MAG: hypothetical protein V2B20_15210 [Pseudomonadota bacterium]
MINGYLFFILTILLLNYLLELAVALLNLSKGVRVILNIARQ